MFKPLPRRRGALVSALAALVGLGSCSSPKACKSGTVLVAFTLEGVTATADRLVFSASTAGAAPVINSVDHSPNQATGAIEVDFPQGYPRGQTVTVYLVAVRNGEPLGNGTATPVTLNGVCATTTVVVTPVAADAGIDLAPADVDGGVDVGVGAGGDAGVDAGGGDLGPKVSVYQISMNQQIDILFMIDNSGSMAPLQAKLLAAAPTFMNVLKTQPAGLPDIHLAVVSSDTGPGTYDLPAIHCSYLGDGGLFQTAPRGACATSPLPQGQTYLQASANQAQKNYSGDITDAFTCIAALGNGGCGFAGPLKSVRWALDTSQDDDDPAPDGTAQFNQGFLRRNAGLAVILVTNKDDCSVPTYSDLIDPTSIHDADRYGPLWPFRCNEFGHLCTTNVSNATPAPGAPPNTAVAGRPSHPLRGVNTDILGCVSNDSPPVDPANPNGIETRVTDEVGFLKGLKSDPSQILVAAITGPTMPYSTDLISQTLSDGTTEMQPNTLHSCVETSGEYGDPAVRIAQWALAFGGNGLLLPICADSFAPALTSIANAIVQLLGPSCIAGTVRDDSAGNPECTVTDRYLDQNSMEVDTPVPSCAANGNTPPCWSLDASVSRCGAGSGLLVVNRGTTTLPSNVETDASCTMCTGSANESGCP